MLGHTFADLLVALGLGLLVGLQKERVESPLAGLRTFALVTLFGAVAALLVPTAGPWIVAAGLLAVAALMITGNFVLLHAGQDDGGQTTEVAVVLMYLVGALTVVGPRPVALVVGGAVAVLIHLKEELRGIVRRLSDKDVRAMMQFVVISLVILPTVPNETFGPYDVLNPRQIWWMVVLIVGINLAGYAGFRLLGTRAGTALAGVLGGVVSSTATTVAYARMTKGEPSTVKAAAVVVWIASGVVFVRILVEVGAVAPDFLPVAAPPMLIMLVLFAVVGLLVWRSAASPGESPLEPGNPTELKPAILFAVLYAVVLLAVAAAEDYLGDAGLYAAAAVSGLTDIDAITLSTSQLVGQARIDPGTGWRLILLASLSNLLFKLGMVAALGTRALLRRLATLVGLALALGGTLLFFWG